MGLASSKPTFQPFRFLDLPREIRYMVYERLPRTTKHITIVTHPHLGATLTLIMHSTPTSILATCHQAYDEARPFVQKAISDWVIEGGVKLVVSSGPHSIRVLEVVAQGLMEKLDAELLSNRQALADEQAGYHGAPAGHVFCEKIPPYVNDIQGTLLNRAACISFTNPAYYWSGCIAWFRFLWLFSSSSHAVVPWIDKSAAIIMKQKLSTAPEPPAAPQLVDIVFRVYPWQRAEDVTIGNLIYGMADLDGIQRIFQLRGVRATPWGWIEPNAELGSARPPTFGRVLSGSKNDQMWRRGVLAQYWRHRWI
ncbi:hypothetical protein BU26DRAFT_507970 [Trematosphaeria pertusa]|uniref:Uncharacterized protein n=1 Tax=Trematosphaeria pertusa TaxID=390896 RepID=A0A6A6I6Y1_9PLEO|nr:uncharacterized protein BU26DRAFT_507970 [Trematosphaeria pertusa]KAF2245283.1 hypothetical protein BU26DRAFT_507970 [Trematosphaeria pertusa]